MAGEVEAIISCLCGEHKHIYSIPLSVRDLEFFVCHCNSCRKVSGAALHQGAVIWSYFLKSVSETDKTPTDPKCLLKQYDFGPSLDFWYCETCSTKMYWQYKALGSPLELFPDLIPESLLISGRLRVSKFSQVYVGDTLDEGLSMCFRNATGAIGARHQAGMTSAMFEAQDIQPEIVIPEKPIQGSCHCGQTTLKLERKRYKVELDTNDHSRALNSTAVSVWALVHAKDVLKLNHLPFDKLGNEGPDRQIGSLSTYAFSGGENTVYFCSGCSATVLLRSGSPGRNQQLRIGSGLLASVGGARKEDILDWSDVKPIEIKHRGIMLDPKDFPKLV